MDKIVLAIILIGVFVAWLTHIFHCFATAAWGFLIAGAIFALLGFFTASGCGSNNPFNKTNVTLKGYFSHDQYCRCC